MVQIIVGEKGKGKTKVIINQANEKILRSEGSVVYIDKSNKHMYELNNRLRLISVKDYFVENYKEFIGFICGIISQDHDLECVYVDSFLKVAHIDESEVETVIEKLKMISEHFHIDFVLSISIASKDTPSSLVNDVLVAL
ncbi:twitching motility protein PilT [Anaerosporobacter faecicola]|uniref:twitching motility protein PilT n=1 Tax=Anaerosporobacter faecicola TaxID=2718714 RepID=UPI00143C208D|nr:twitching motility protein PilT [Anaerosporobacter faecicola]